MKLLVVNVNTTASMTAAIADSARSVAAPGTEIVGLTPAVGADSVEGNFESYLAAVAVMSAVVTYDGPFDAVVQAGFGEHGREGLQELLDVPVVDITEAAGHVASLIGHRYSVVTTLDRTVPLIEDRLVLAGLRNRCASVRSSGMTVLQLEEDYGGQGDRAGGRAGRPRRSSRGDLPRVRRHGRPRRGRPAGDRRARRRRGDRRGHARREPRSAGAVDEQGAHLRAAASQAHRGLAADSVTRPS